MTRNPIFNALGAAGYISLVVAIMNLISHTQRNKPDTAFAPLVVLSLLTLSAAVMSYLFFYQPLQLLIDGKKKEAVNFFVKTVAIFAIFPIVAVILLTLGII